VPVPLPPRGTESRDRPSRAESQLVADAITWAVRGPDGLTGTQRMLVRALLEAMTDHAVEIDEGIETDATTLAAGFRERDRAYRTRVVQLTLLCALVARPLPPEVVDRVAALASELWVEERMIRVARELAAGSLGLAAVDFQRNGYTQHWDPAARGELHASRELHDAWEAAADDPGLAARWLALADLPLDTLGHAVWRLYRTRGFVVPGRPGSAPVLLAQHDWVHVLADYGTTVENELETFAFVARANDDMSGFSLLAMVVSLFETGYLKSGMGLFESDEDHISDDDRMVVRVADAMRRGALCEDLLTSSTSIDFLALDWFELAPLSLSQARARFQIPPKTAAAVEAGSVGPFEPGGITEFQVSSARMLADAAGRPEEAGGAPSP
jgi:hypothetical protein